MLYVKLIKSLTFEIFFAVWTILIGGVALPLALVVPKRRRFMVPALWSGFILKMLRWLCGITFEVRGAHLLPEAPFIIASKHQSTWETVFFLKYFYNPAFILKKELKMIPVYGWYLPLLGMIDIDRSQGVGAVKKVIRQFAQLRDRALIIFPEGTRVQAGSKGKYNSGIAALHKHYKDVSIVPVALNSGLYWPRRRLIKQPGKIIIEFLPPIHSPDMSKRELMEQIETQVEEATNQLI